VTRAGRRIGDYTLIDCLGEGGMGTVWRGEHAILGRRAAIKLLHHSFASRADIVTRFFNEARAASAIPDLGIVQIFDFGRDADGTVYIVMELLDGEPLDHRLRRNGALPLDVSLRLVRQVASSLSAAHTRGIVHRDLKPENIFIVRDPEVVGGERTKLLDFGIAKLSDQVGVKTQTSAVMGTPTFMSPEQCRGAGHVDQRSDIYSLGCVLFTLLTGRPPFDAEGAGDILAMHLREPPPVPSLYKPDVPRELDELVARCLAKDPTQRYSSGVALVAALEAVLVGTASTSHAHDSSVASDCVTCLRSTPTTLSSGAAEVAPPRRTSVLGIGAFVVAIAAAGIVFEVSRRPRSEPAALAPVTARAASFDAAFADSGVPEAAIPDAPPPPEPRPDAAIPDAAIPERDVPGVSPTKPPTPPKRRPQPRPTTTNPAAPRSSPPTPAAKKSNCDRDGDGVPDDWSCT